MTISSTSRKSGPYSCNGSTIAFPFAFKVFTTADVLVVLTDALGVEVNLALGTNYTVAINADQDANPGGTVTTTATYATGYLVTLTSQVQNLQPVTIPNQGGFYPKVINDALDRLTVMVQQVAEKAGRALTLPISAGGNAGLPGPTPGGFIGWDSLGQTLMNYAGVAGVAVTNFMATVLQTTNAAAARAALGAGTGDALQAGIQAQTYVAFTAGGISGAQTVTTSPAYGNLVAGERMRIKFGFASTGADTLNRDAKGAKSLKQYDNTGAKVAAVFVANQLADVEYDGTDYVVLDALPASMSIASTAEAQALTDNTKALSALRLKEALQGSNQSLAAGGYQKFPGGLIVEWGACQANITPVAVTFPLAFPTACYAVVLVAQKSSGTTYQSGVSSVTTSGFSAHAGSGLQDCYYIAIGK
jgi:hypothetical protein